MVLKGWERAGTWAEAVASSGAENGERGRRPSQVDGLKVL